MIIVGLLLFAAAVVIAAALIVQNPAAVTVDAFNQSWSVGMRWLFVAGLALTAVGLLGLAMMRFGGARYMRLRGERRVLKAENKRLSKRAAAAAPVGAGHDTAPRTTPVARAREPVPASASSQRRGFRQSLVGARHRG
jgi:uncharacterized integral membrane protein